jgi:hypothetical protein
MTEINFNELFYSELIKEDTKNVSINQNEYGNLCKISNEIADESYIELECNHGFNYDSIYNEVYIQKYVFNPKETVKLSKYQLKCPYCRQVQNTLLPGREGYDNILYVNMPKKYRMKKKKCSYIFKRGKRKGVLCGKFCEENFCDKCIVLERKCLERLSEKQIS